MPQWELNQSIDSFRTTAKLLSFDSCGCEEFRRYLSKVIEDPVGPGGTLIALANG
jgi:hypothetical protein